MKPSATSTVRKMLARCAATDTLLLPPAPAAPCRRSSPGLSSSAGSARRFYQPFSGHPARPLVRAATRDTSTEQPQQLDQPDQLDLSDQRAQPKFRPAKSSRTEAAHYIVYLASSTMSNRGSAHDDSGGAPHRSRPQPVRASLGNEHRAPLLTKRSTITYNDDVTDGGKPWRDPRNLTRTKSLTAP